MTACSAYEVRPYRPADRGDLLDITREVFASASLDRLAEDHWGQELGGTPWWQRKQADVAADLDAQPDGVLVAVSATGEVVGYVTGRVWPDVSTGWIHNLAVRAAHQRRGVARTLLQAVLSWFETQGLQYAKIETLASNEAGRHLYPTLGFEELALQVHYTLDLGARHGAP